jgi:signal transduction histidine kinase/CheY-like chemotaxis protein
MGWTDSQGVEEGVPAPEKALAIANRALRVLSACTEALIRASSEEKLLEEICQILVTAGRYRLAWVGYAESDAARSVRPVAQMGYEEGYLAGLNISWADTPQGRGPTGTAIRTGQNSVARDILTDPTFAPWRSAACSRGYASSLALPLSLDGRTIGALNVYAIEPDAFGPQEVELLESLAGSMAFGIGSLRDREQNQRAEKQRLHLEQQLQQAQKLEAIGTLAGGLTRQLLVFSRRQPMRLAPHDLSKTVAHLTTMLRRLIPENVAMEVSSAPGIWMVSADEGNIEQAITNLVVNARDAMPDGGDLRIETSNVTLGEGVPAPARPGRFVHVRVSDDGHGMAEDALQRIFEPFFTTKAAGTGLGLSVVYGIVGKHEGWIDVTSEPGLGTTFDIYFPALSDAKARPTAHCSEDDTRGQGEHILLVEDEPDVRAFIERALVQNGYSVQTAFGVEQAVAAFERSEGGFDLIFSDVILTDGDGLSLADQCLTSAPGTRVLLCSGHTGEIAKQDEIEGLGYFYLHKPFSIAALLSAVRSALAEPD